MRFPYSPDTNYKKQNAKRFCSRLQIPGGCPSSVEHFKSGGTCYEGDCAMSRFFLKFPNWGKQGEPNINKEVLDFYEKNPRLIIIQSDERQGIGAMCDIELIKKIQEAKNA